MILAVSAQVAVQIAAQVAETGVSTKVIIGVAGSIITTLGLIIVTILNNRRERRGSSEASMEATLRERIVFKEEIITHLQQGNQKLTDENSQLRQDKADLQERVRYLESIERRHGRARRDDD